MQRPPPTSTFFPYTTLYRSVKRIILRMLFAFLFIFIIIAVYTLRDNYRFVVVEEEVSIDSFPDTLENLRILQIRDRKSTRLNSSHVAISYAVFCLKKKNQH